MEGLGQRDDAELGDVVGGHPRTGHEPRHRCGVHDVPLAALREHDRHEGLHAVDDAPQVHAEHPLPVVERELPGVARTGDAGVVADDVHGTERGERLLGEIVDLGRLGDVGADREHLRALRLDRLGGSGERLLLDVGEDDHHAFGGEALGHAAADSAGGSGDDGDAILQILHVGHVSRSGRVTQAETPAMAPRCGPFAHPR